jgi:hypothetical protein
VGESPKVYVDRPKLRRQTPEEPIPHTFADDRPCLFYPDGNEWSAKSPIALTIVPWLMEWLVYYEAWLFTGEWQGGGLHLGKPEEKEASNTIGREK